ncbi:Cti6 protein [Martiniozyma asiatica (nom. inval.)]|nr:Cti6 protein [Martiniozyma asiatica]
MSRRARRTHLQPEYAEQDPDLEIENENENENDQTKTQSQNQNQSQNDLDGENENDVEEENEADEVTRCVCQQDDVHPPHEDTGFFIQCDKCSVWQHGYCVDIYEENAPDKYWCESCRPWLHNLWVDKFNFQRSKYTPDAGRPTLNSRVYDAQLNMALQESMQDVQNTTKTEGRTKNENENENETETETKTKIAENSIDIKTIKESGRTGSEGQNKEINIRVQTHGQSTINEDNNDTGNDADVGDDEDNADIEEDEVNINSGNKQRGGLSQKNEKTLRIDKEAITSTLTNEKSGSLKQEAPKKRGKSGNFKHDTLDEPKRKKKKENKDKDDKPFRPNLPSVRITHSEMIRRIYAIMEFLGNIQINLSAEEEFKKGLLDLNELNSECQKLKDSLVEGYNDCVNDVDDLLLKVNTWVENYD